MSPTRGVKRPRKKHTHLVTNLTHRCPCSWVGDGWWTTEWRRRLHCSGRRCERRREACGLTAECSQNFLTIVCLIILKQTLHRIQKNQFSYANSRASCHFVLLLHLNDLIL